MSFKATIAIFVNIIVVAALVLRIASADENSVRFNVHYFSIYTEPSPASLVTATLSCDRLFAEDDTILRLRANGIIDNVKPDFAPLERDFTIRRIVFGHRDWLTPQGLTARTEWTIQLRPLKTGEFTLPALNIGPMVTEPLRLIVQNKQQTDIATLTEHVRVEVETVPKHPYVNGQILYTVRMLFDEWLVDGNLSSPVFEKAYSRKLNKHYSYDTERDGHRYKVSEYRYIVFPEHSGHFVIPGPTFSGAIAYRGYAEHEDTKCTSPLEFTTEPTVISVLPPPSGYNESDWLPSEQLTLTVTPPVQTSPLKFGEPLVRNIVITAKGLSAAAIPDLPLSQLDNAQIYPGRRQAETQLTDDGLVSVIEQTITILPVRTGILTLPAISLAWWDTLHQRKQISSFPAQTISIVPVTQTKQIRAVVDKESVFGSLRYWGPVCIFLFMGLTTGLIYKGLVRYGWRHYRQLLLTWSAQRAVRKACQRHDPAETAHALLNWSAVLWPAQPAGSLGELIKRLHTEAGPLRDLDRRLYAAGSTTSWDSGNLYRLLQKQRFWQSGKKPGTRAKLAPLYPETDLE